MRALVALGLSLCACARAGADVVPPRSPEGGGLTVMSFNVHIDEARDASTVDAVGAPDADIVCLQEPSAAWEHALRARYATQYPHMTFATDEESGGLAVLSRYPIASAQKMTVHDWHPALRVLVETPEGPLQIVNVHLRARFEGEHDPLSDFFESDDDHRAEMETFMEDALPHVPTVVLGDFNEGANGLAVQWLEARGFTNALPRFHPGQHTWRGRTVLAGLVSSLDHVLYTRPLEPIDAWLPPRGRSDHMPVMVRFRVRRAWGMDEPVTQALRQK